MRSDPVKTRPHLCRHYLSSRAVTSQVFSARVSLTAVFGMGTGGPSPQSAPTSSAQASYRSLRLRQKLAHSAVPPLKLKTASLGFDFVFKGTLLHVLFLFQPLLRLKPLSSPRSAPTPGGVVHLQGLEPWTP